MIKRKVITIGFIQKRRKRKINSSKKKYSKTNWHNIDTSKKRRRKFQASKITGPAKFSASLKP